jgi:hypothetical protein
LERPKLWGKTWLAGHFQRNDLLTEFYEILIGSNVTNGGHTDRQHGELISFALLFKENWQTEERDFQKVYLPMAPSGRLLMARLCFVSFLLSGRVPGRDIPGKAAFVVVAVYFQG